jgi:hypothetical protein
MVDMGILLGSIRRFGLAGPAYEVIGPAASTAAGDAQMRIHVFESDEELDYPVSDILSDPLDS